MKKVFGLGIAALALALAPATARAQNAVVPAAPPPAAAPTDSIGPAQLRDFNLKGTVTRRADPQPDAPQPRRQAPPTTNVPTTTTTAAEAPRTARAAPSPRTQAPSAERPAAVLPDAVTLPPLTAAPARAFTESVEPTAAPVLPADPASGGFSFLPWLLAALAAAGAASFYSWKQRSRPAYAGAGMAFEAQPEAAPVPVPTPKLPAKDAPRISPSGGIVSSRIRPWLEIEFTPARCIYSDNGAVIEFEASLYNSGGAPARDVLLEAKLFNAGQANDEEVNAFFAHPHGEGNRIPEIKPLTRLSVKSAVSLTREQLRAYRLEERLLWVPAIGFTALYRWSGGNGQTSSSFILGRETKGEKMAAFRLDQGARVFRGLGARPHTVAVRK